MNQKKFLLRGTDHVQQLLNDQVFSYSRLKLFEDCPYRWFLKYVERIEQDDVLPLMLGKAVHAAIESKMNGLSDKDALLNGWEEVDYFDFDLHEYERLFQNANVQRGEALNDNVEVERHFTIHLDGDDSPRLQGYIDVIRTLFGAYEIIDWKTNRVIYEPMDNMQLALYAWAISKTHNVTDVTGTLFFLRFYREKRKSKLFRSEEMESARKWALDIANAVTQGLDDYFNHDKPMGDCFPAKAHSGCATCPFADRCLNENPKISEGVFVI